MKKRPILKHTSFAVPYATLGQPISIRVSWFDYKWNCCTYRSRINRRSVSHMFVLNDLLNTHYGRESMRMG